MTPREEQLAQLLAECQSALADSRRENALLRQKIDLLIKRVFGPSSEVLDRSQLQILVSPKQVAWLKRDVLNLRYDFGRMGRFSGPFFGL